MVLQSTEKTSYLCQTTSPMGGGSPCLLCDEPEVPTEMRIPRPVAPARVLSWEGLRGPRSSTDTAGHTWGSLLSLGCSPCSCRPVRSPAHGLPSAVCLGFLPTQSDSHYDFGGFCEHHKHVSYLRREPLAPDPVLWDAGRGDIAAPREAETRSPGEGVAAQSLLRLPPGSRGSTRPEEDLGRPQSHDDSQPNRGFQVPVACWIVPRAEGTHDSWGRGGGVRSGTLPQWPL